MICRHGQHSSGLTAPSSASSDSSGLCSITSASIMSDADEMLSGTTTCHRLSAAVVARSCQRFRVMAPHSRSSLHYIWSACSNEGTQHAACTQAKKLTEKSGPASDLSAWSARR